MNPLAWLRRWLRARRARRWQKRWFGYLNDYYYGSKTDALVEQMQRHLRSVHPDLKLYIHDENGSWFVVGPQEAVKAMSGRQPYVYGTSILTHLRGKVSDAPLVNFGTEKKTPHVDRIIDGVRSGERHVFADFLESRKGGDGKDNA